MYFIRALLFFTIYLFLCINRVAAVSFKTKCKLADSKCLTNTAQDFAPLFAQGIPELGVNTTDPIHITKIDASIGPLKLIIKDSKFTGLKDTIIRNISIDETNMILSLKLYVTVNLESKYEMSGNLLFLTVRGRGPLHAKLRNMGIQLDLYLKEKQFEDGKPHWYVVYKNHGFKQKEKSLVVFENLFEDSPILATAANEMIAQNSNEIVEEVGPKIIKRIVDEVVDHVNDFFRKMDLKDLYIN